MSDDTLHHAKAILAAQEQKYRRSASRWKFGYRALLVLSAFLASAAAIVGKLTLFPEHGNDAASVLAAGAAVIATVLGALDFESNFRINRRSRHQVQVLLLDAEKSGANADVLLEGLKQVINQRTHDLDKPD